MAEKNFKTRYLLAFYVFPIVCETKEEFTNIFHPRMKGIFVGDTNKPEWEDKIVVCFETCAPKKFKDFYKDNKYSYKSYYENIDGNLYEILSFQIPPEYKNDLAKVLNNNFSEVSESFRIHIDWISFPQNSNDYWTNNNYLHGKLWEIQESKIRLNLNDV